jgi:pyrroloquinoline quinone biosynthesis protein D
MGVKLNRRARLQLDKVTGKPILLYPEGVLMLNVTSEAIVKLCDGTRTIPEMAAHLAETYHAPKDVIEADVRKLLDRLAQLNLISAPEPDSAEIPPA